MNRRDALKKTALLAGAAITGPSIIALFQSCQRTDRLNWQPQFLNEDQALFISSFVDTLLPATDTPGGLDVKADIFIDLFFAKAYDDEAQQEVRDNIDQLNSYSENNYGAVFADLNAEDRKRCLLDHEEESGKFRKSVWGTAVGEEERPPDFYRSLKSMTLWAYFSSEEVGREHLVYDPVPGEYRGCLPLTDVGNSWTF